MGAATSPPAPCFLLSRSADAAQQQQPRRSRARLACRARCLRKKAKKPNSEYALVAWVLSAATHSALQVQLLARMAHCVLPHEGASGQAILHMSGGDVLQKPSDSA